MGLSDVNRRRVFLSICVCYFERRVVGLLEFSDQAGVTSIPGSIDPPSRPPKVLAIRTVFQPEVLKALNF